MRNCTTLLGLALLLAIGCGTATQTAETTAEAMPEGARMIALDLPGMT